MKTKALILMRDDTENKKAMLTRLIRTGWHGFLFFCGNVGAIKL